MSPSNDRLLAATAALAELPRPLPLRDLTAAVADLFSADFAVLTEHDPAHADTARVLHEVVRVPGGTPRDHYSLLGTPCHDVYRGSPVAVDGEFARRFPHDPALPARGVESYLGVPVRTYAGVLLGHLAVMFRDPVTFEPGCLAALGVFADRAAAELDARHLGEVWMQNAVALQRSIAEALHQDLAQQLTAINVGIGAAAASPDVAEGSGLQQDLRRLVEASGTAVQQTRLIIESVSKLPESGDLFKALGRVVDVYARAYDLPWSVHSRGAAPSMDAGSIALFARALLTLKRRASILQPQELIETFASVDQGQIVLDTRFALPISDTAAAELGKFIRLSSLPTIRAALDTRQSFEVSPNGSRIAIAVD